MVKPVLVNWGITGGRAIVARPDSMLQAARAVQCFCDPFVSVRVVVGKFLVIVDAFPDDGGICWNSRWSVLGSSTGRGLSVHVFRILVAGISASIGTVEDALDNALALEACHVDFGKLQNDLASQHGRKRGLAPSQSRAQGVVLAHIEPHRRGAWSREAGQPHRRPGCRGIRRGDHPPSERPSGEVRAAR